MSIDITTPWGAVINSVFGIIDKIIPDPQAKAAAQLQVLKLQQEGELKQLDNALQLSLAQISTNNIEAASNSLFKSGWRPFIGWVCGGGLVYQYLLRPLFIGLGFSMFPSLEIDTLMTLLFGMLGLGTLRTVEKVKGAA